MPIPGEVVVDVEIINPVGENALTWDDTDKLGISIACLYDYDSDVYRFFDEFNLHELRARLTDASRITGFNIWKFDFPVIWKRRKDTPDYIEFADSLLLPKTNDLLRRIWQAGGHDPDVFTPSTHSQWGLEQVVFNTLYRGKSPQRRSKLSHGASAPKMFKEGKLPQLYEYCLHDVRLERELSEFVDKYHYVCNDTERREL